MSNDGPLDDAFGLTPQPKGSKELITDQLLNGDSNLKNDYEYARKNMQSLIETGITALDELASVAEQSQNPRAYEVLASLIKTLAETNKDLLNLTGLRRTIEPSTVQTNQTINSVNNAVFIGTNAELQKALKSIQSEMPNFVKSQNNGRPIIDGEAT